MAKSIFEAIRHREALQALRQTVTETSAAGHRVHGFTKTYSQEDLERIDADRAAMRGRLLSDG